MRTIFQRTSMYPLSIKNKLLVFFAFVIVGISFISLTSLYFNYKVINYSMGHLQEYYTINQLKMLISDNESVLQKYLRETNEADYELLLRSSKDIELTLQTIDHGIASLDTYLQFRAISNALISQQHASNLAIEQRLNGDDYYPTYLNVLKINKYIGQYIDELLNVSLREGNWHYKKLISQSEVLKKLVWISLVLMIILFVGFGYVFSHYLTGPIRRLVMASQQMAIGNLDIQLEVKSRDEVGILTQSFNKMSASIRNHVEELKQKAQVENKLYEEEMKNIQMQQLLQNAKFMGLQSQINPHFLFNTLNIIARTSMFEGADKTTKLIQSMAQIFRYNLQASDKAVSLKTELNILQEYIFIQNYRFGSRIKIEIRCHEQELPVNEILIPSLTIQPLVENSIVHGLEVLEAGGQVRISVYPQQDDVVIQISDNGVGMSKQKLSRIEFDEAEKHTGHTTGIGIGNVMSRLRLYYNHDCLRIRSKVNFGTVITIRIPTKKEILQQ